MLLSTSTVNDIAQFITVIIIFIAVLVITVFTSKWIADYQRGKLKGTNVDVIESVRIAPNKFVQIIRIADKTVAVATCKDTVTMLCELDQDAVISLKQSGSPSSFSELFKKSKAELEQQEDNRGES